MMQNTEHRLITGLDISDYFRDSITSAASNQHLDINTETLLYVVNMLTAFTLFIGMIWTLPWSVLTISMVYTKLFGAEPKTLAD